MKETESWVAALDALFRRMAPHFQTEAAFNRTNAYLEGLLSSADRKNTWQLAEILGEKDVVPCVDETGFLKKGGHSAGVPSLSLQDKKCLQQEY